MAQIVTQNAALQNLIDATGHLGYVVVNDDVLYAMVKAAELAEKPASPRRPVSAARRAAGKHIAFMLRQNAIERL